MISLTAFASTSKLDQKQKTEFKIEPSVQIEAVNVANDFQVVFVLTRTTFLNNSEVKGFAISNVNPFLAELTDVGWKRKKQSYQSISYQDKLLENYNLNFKNQFNSVPNMRSNC
ncbi:MAG: hypothetical protein V4683_11950 [Bacteroidota bacterium]